MFVTNSNSKLSGFVMNTFMKFPVAGSAKSYDLESSSFLLHAKRQRPIMIKTNCLNFMVLYCLSVIVIVVVVYIGCYSDIVFIVIFSIFMFNLEHVTKV